MKYTITAAVFYLSAVSVHAVSLPIGISQVSDVNGAVPINYDGRVLTYEGVEYLNIDEATQEELTFRWDPYPVTGLDLSLLTPGGPAPGTFPAADPLYQPPGPLTRKFFKAAGCTHTVTPDPSNSQGRSGNSCSIYGVTDAFTGSNQFSVENVEYLNIVDGFTGNVDIALFGVSFLGDLKLNFLTPIQGLPFPEFTFGQSNFNPDLPIVESDIKLEYGIVSGNVCEPIPGSSPGTCANRVDFVSG